MSKTQVMDFFKKYTMVIALVIVTAFFTWQTAGKMLLPQNVYNLVAQNAFVFILATGMLLCILTGGNIDLSVGSLICFVGAIGGVMMVNMKMSIWLAMAAMVLVGIIIGAWQGYWIAYVRIPPFIVTLAGMLIFRGLANAVLQGKTIAPIPDDYTIMFSGFVPDIFGNPTLFGTTEFNVTCMLIGVIAVVLYVGSTLFGRISKAKKGYELPSFGGTIGRLTVVSIAILAFMFRLAQHKGIPNVLIWVLVVVLIYNYITSRTRTGRYFYAVGGNEKAAELSGINTNRVYFLAYTNMGFLSGIAALVVIARFKAATPTAGTSYEMDAIGSCFIGGASAYGGIGTVPGVIVGAILMGVINLGMFIMAVDSNYQSVVKGGVLLLAVIFDVVSKKKTA